MMIKYRERGQCLIKLLSRKYHSYLIIFTLKPSGDDEIPHFKTTCQQLWTLTHVICVIMLIGTINASSAIDIQMTQNEQLSPIVCNMHICKQYFR